MDPGLKNKVALVTGGSMGIGKATAMALAQQGAQVAICARGLEALKATAQEIKDATESQVISIRADMTSAEDIKMLVFSTVQALGEIDILVNNAVNSTSGRASELSDEVWLNHIQTKVMGYIRCAREVVPSRAEDGLSTSAAWAPATPARPTPAQGLPIQGFPTSLKLWPTTSPPMVFWSTAFIPAAPEPSARWG